MRRGPLQPLGLVLLLLVAAAGAPACGVKNEAIVCSSDDGVAGPSCAAKYKLCSGAVYDMKCVSKGTGVECQCIEEGVEKSKFTSEDACNVSPQTRRQRARDGCKWTLD